MTEEWGLELGSDELVNDRLIWGDTKYCEDCENHVEPHDLDDQYMDKCEECARLKREDDRLWAQEKRNYYYN